MVNRKHPDSWVAAQPDWVNAKDARLCLDIALHSSALRYSGPLTEAQNYAYNIRNSAQKEEIMREIEAARRELGDGFR